MLNIKPDEGVMLKLTSAVVVDGEVCRAGSLVELTTPEARNLLERGKAVLATEDDAAPLRAAEAAAKAEAEAQAFEQAAAEAEAAAKAAEAAAVKAKAKAKTEAAE